MKNYFKLGLILCIITTLSGFILGLSYEGTKESIAKNGKLDKKELSILMPEAEAVREKTDITMGNENIKEVLQATKGNEVVGYLIMVSSKGFHGEIKSMIGITKQGEISGIKVVSHSETPGVGSKIEKKDFTQGFNGKKINSGIKLVKTETSKDSEVQGVTGATVSSTAVATGVNEAINYYKSNLKGAE